MSAVTASGRSADPRAANAEAIPLAVLGASGRMGGAVLARLAEFPALELRGAFTAPDSGLGGRDAGEVAGLGPLGVPLSERLDTALAGSRVAIDFTLADAGGSIPRWPAAGSRSTSPWRTRSPARPRPAGRRGSGWCAASRGWTKRRARPCGKPPGTCRCCGRPT